ncbi:MAG: EI24 domain-containing protein [Rubrivivax sp.]|nr:EI24 domain-containing protein [Rubrivivax sp.]
MFEAFWRAFASLWHPRVLVWTLLPLLVMGLAVAVAAWLGWEAAIDGVRAGLERFDLTNAALQWLDSVGANNLRAMLAPIIVVALAVPVVVVGTLLLVGWLMTPVVVQVVARRRFAALERAHGARWWQGFGWSLACGVGALLALVASLPLWLIPPLALVLPPLVWGWLACRVYAFDVLADHASAEERRHLMYVHRWPLLAMGVVSGALGMLPALLWGVGPAALVFAPFLLIGSVWLYALVFAFSALWFAHYALARLAALRTRSPGTLVDAPVPGGGLPDGSPAAGLPAAPAPARPPEADLTDTERAP